MLSHQEYNEDQSITILGRYSLTFVNLDDLGQFRDHYVSGRENKTLPITFICGLSLFCSITLNLCGKNEMEEDVVWSKVGEGAPRQTYDKTSNGPHMVFYVPGLLKMEKL